jgi:hypothetical protein
MLSAGKLLLECVVTLLAGVLGNAAEPTIRGVRGVVTDEAGGLICDTRIEVSSQERSFTTVASAPPRADGSFQREATWMENL